jgi:hypothetical protein
LLKLERNREAFRFGGGCPFQQKVALVGGGGRFSRLAELNGGIPGGIQSAKQKAEPEEQKSAKRSPYIRNLESKKADRSVGL